MSLMNDFSVKLTSLISSYEQDLRLPGLDMLIKISTEFGVSTDYLLNLNIQKEMSSLP